MCFESSLNSDVGKHVECDDKYWLCYKAEIRCERSVSFLINSFNESYKLNDKQGLSNL